ncbi:MAG: hypothetical protein JXQ27_16580 [Acidobacteria bacterium]|nr:hypothetical protein [Acidobacteriota bacterium]
MNSANCIKEMTGRRYGCSGVLPRRLNPLWAGCRAVLLGLLLVVCPGFPVGFAALINKVVADVGGNPITLREVRIVASLQKGRLVDRAETEILQESARLLLEQEIIWLEIADGNPPDNVDEAAQEIRNIFALAAGGTDALEQLRTALGVTDAEWSSLLHRQARVMLYTAVQFSPMVYVAPEEIQRYYQTEFLPALDPDASVPPLDRFRDRIEEIIRQHKINRELADWLERRKLELNVRLFLDAD